MSHGLNKNFQFTQFFHTINIELFFLFFNAFVWSSLNTTFILTTKINQSHIMNNNLKRIIFRPIQTGLI